MKQLTVTPALYEYMLNISLRENAILHNLRQETARLALAEMQVAPEQAQFMQFLLSIVKAKKVLELGTFTGYSALAMALALPDDGKLITCDINPEWTEIAQRFWTQAKQEKKIELRLAPALVTLENLISAGEASSFDFIFIDADKTNYVEYYELALKLLQPEGIIAIDNIFWKGDVLQTKDATPQTKAIQKLNRLLKQDTRVKLSLLAIADGLFLIKHHGS